MSKGLTKEDEKYKTSPKPDQQIINPKNFIYELLKTNDQGNFINLTDQSMIKRFYEFIFIMLKLKNIDYQAYTLENIEAEINYKLPPVMPGGTLDRSYLTYSSHNNKKLSTKQVHNYNHNLNHNHSHSHNYKKVLTTHSTLKKQKKTKGKQRVKGNKHTKSSMKI